MTAHRPPPLTPTAFLQTFIAQSINVAGQLCSLEDRDRQRYIEHLGLAAASCMESAGRVCQSIDADAPLDQARYANLIVEIKNHIGGQFQILEHTRGHITVVNHVCPFGEAVKQAPELCRMTSSVFGAIGARNFGYAKVHLSKRIAVGDGCCEARVYLESALATDKPGDEYHAHDGAVSSGLSGSEDPELQRRLGDTWCAAQHASGRKLPGMRIVAESRAMRAALDAARTVAPTDASVLITGETGVGKEVVARTIHVLSPRRDNPFVTLNCGAIPEGLVESELFGHERGAFTGACDVHRGFFERADGGTLFLDEINSLPLAAQVKLLRVLQEGAFERVGGAHTQYVDVRVVAASNQDPDELLHGGRLRHDLYYRLNVVPIDIPPLRRRIDDLSALAQAILSRLAEKYDRGEKLLGPDAWRQLLAHDWPGNIRELENRLERAYLFTEGRLIDRIGELALPETDESGDGIPLRELKREAANAAESRAIRDSLRRYRGRVSAVARELGVTPRAVQQKLKSHGIKPAEYRQPEDQQPHNRTW
ncbi:hypothetical protein BJI67_01785 [Acidihalobacter aeolianus]|uniref:Sigma-54 factor interaction domain-containing protein n=1 Tax=Acidihalobacter aeolianus TaxID=2792603 RepID=A0A1D8K4V2_9GAMM|nr:sigma 54-interacting transcriptional regulator [Acidihalobacter aeolianus]AOV15974.1 hypothetical protein BJI67_01785 [Acidihalobacter aeolianus]